MTMNWRLTRSAAVAAIGLTLAAAPGAAGAGTFVQPVHVLHTFHGPTTGKGAYFGWAVSQLGDIDGDHVTDLVIGECLNGGSHIRGQRVGVLGPHRPAHLPPGPGPRERPEGYAVADAGDVNGDGVPDVVSGAPGVGKAVGHAYVYSGATGKMLVQPARASRPATSSARRSRAPAT